MDKVACQCKIVFHLPDEATIEHCHLHAMATEMLESLKIAIQCWDEHNDTRNDWVARGRAAIDCVENWRLRR